MVWVEELRARLSPPAGQSQPGEGREEQRQRGGILKMPAGRRLWPRKWPPGWRPNTGQSKFVGPGPVGAASTDAPIAYLIFARALRALPRGQTYVSAGFIRTGASAVALTETNWYRLLLLVQSERDQTALL